MGFETRQTAFRTPKGRGPNTAKRRVRSRQRTGLPRALWWASMERFCQLETLPMNFSRGKELKGGPSYPQRSQPTLSDFVSVFLRFPVLVDC